MSDFTAKMRDFVWKSNNHINSNNKAYVYKAVNYSKRNNIGKRVFGERQTFVTKVGNNTNNYNDNDRRSHVRTFSSSVSSSMIRTINTTTNNNMTITRHSHNNKITSNNNGHNEKELAIVTEMEKIQKLVEARRKMKIKNTSTSDAAPSNNSNNDDKSEGTTTHTTTNKNSNNDEEDVQNNDTENNSITPLEASSHTPSSACQPLDGGTAYVTYGTDRNPATPSLPGRPSAAAERRLREQLSITRAKMSDKLSQANKNRRVIER